MEAIGQRSSIVCVLFSACVTATNDCLYFFVVFCSLLSDDSNHGHGSIRSFELHDYLVQIYCKELAC